MMRRPLIVIFLLALLCACGNREKYARLLAEADSLNQNYIPFTTDSTMKEVVDYYNHHGTANERMRAYYLLGCVYRDLGEAPQALECYHDAVDCADTTSQDCDFRLLGRIHGQMSVIFNSQLLPHDMLRELKEASRIAFIASDTMNAIISIERQAIAFQLLQQPDSVIKVVERACSLYKKYGLNKEEAIAHQILILSYLDKGNYSQAKKCIDVFEKESGLVDKEGEVHQGYESFYYDKGQYYLGIGKLDSAEYYYRKVLHNTMNLNSQEGGNRGLYLVYKQKNIPDSAAKYADISYQINDQRDMLTSSEEVSQMRALYNYSRNENLANKERLARMKTQTWLTSFIALFAILFVLSFSYIRRLRRKRKQELLSYKNNIDKLAHAKEELQQLESMQMKELIERKTLEIQLLGMEIKAYQQIHSGTFAKIESSIVETAIYKRFSELGNAKGEVSAEDWEQLSRMIDTNLPQFHSLINSSSSRLRVDEYRLCILVRLYFSPSEIANILSVKPSSVTMMRRRLHQKVFGATGSAKDFDRKIQLIGRNIQTDEME